MTTMPIDNRQLANGFLMSECPLCLLSVAQVFMREPIVRVYVYCIHTYTRIYIHMYVYLCICIQVLTVNILPLCARLRMTKPAKGFFTQILGILLEDEFTWPSGPSVQSLSTHTPNVQLCTFKQYVVLLILILSLLLLCVVCNTSEVIDSGGMLYVILFFPLIFFGGDIRCLSGVAATTICIHYTWRYCIVQFLNLIVTTILIILF